MNILITGGAGSLGVALVNEIQKTESNTIRILDNNEHSLASIKAPYPSLIRKLYGSITDKERVKRAVHGVDIVIHCAAMKNLEVTEYNVSELIKTNVVGTDNVISASVEAGVKKIMFISSDKAVETTSIYGASKLIGEHTALNYNQISYPASKVSVFRSGNFMSSNGNVFETWEKQIKNKHPLTITDINCKRYFIHTDTAAKTIINCISEMNGGELYIPDESLMPEYKIVDMATTFADNHNTSRSDVNLLFTGLRKGEKISEKLFTAEESVRKTWNKEIHCYIINNR